MTQNNRGFFSEGKFFFELSGNAVMKLSPKAAIEVCQEAAKRNLPIGMIESGHWLNPGFRPDVNTRWDGLDKLTDEGEIKKNNDRAIENINDDVSQGYNAFIITIVGFSK
ncbi:colicin transporter [Pectobacterium zantedeschiae]|uniref:colicin transporter n=1 Tax=Pectobacterium zantedeschiae TaxID=2034769 RepID=UPI001F5D1469|nr:colicin transporter [Pectobacterium zantedeschiae]